MEWPKITVMVFSLALVIGKGSTQPYPPYPPPDSPSGYTGNVPPFNVSTGPNGWPFGYTGDVPPFNLPTGPNGLPFGNTGNVPSFNLSTGSNNWPSGNTGPIGFNASNENPSNHPNPPNLPGTSGGKLSNSPMQNTSLNSSGEISQGAIIGIVVGLVGGTILIIFIVLLVCCITRRKNDEKNHIVDKLEKLEKTSAVANAYEGIPTKGIPSTEEKPAHSEITIASEVTGVETRYDNFRSGEGFDSKVQNADDSNTGNNSGVNYSTEKNRSDTADTPDYDNFRT